MENREATPDEVKDYIDGYLDGHDKNSPEPNGNRSERYAHSFRIARAELSGKPIPAQISRDAAEEIEKRENNR